MQRDEGHLLDTLIAARDAWQFWAGLSLRQFEESRLNQSAVIKALEIIGEAAGRISEQSRQEHPEIPWNVTTGMRNRLVHGYFDFDPETGWNAIHKDLPPLVKYLELRFPSE